MAWCQHLRTIPVFMPKDPTGHWMVAGHHSLNNLVWRALAKANIPSIREPCIKIQRKVTRQPDTSAVGKSQVCDLRRHWHVDAVILSSTSITSGGAIVAAAERDWWSPREHCSFSMSVDDDSTIQFCHYPRHICHAHTHWGGHLAISAHLCLYFHHLFLTVGIFTTEGNK